MTAQRTYFLFKNDIALTVKDARNKGERSEEIDSRLRTQWGMSLEQFEAFSGM